MVGTTGESPRSRRRRGRHLQRRGRALPRRDRLPLSLPDPWIHRDHLARDARRRVGRGGRRRRDFRDPRTDGCPHLSSRRGDRKAKSATAPPGSSPTKAKSRCTAGPTRTTARSSTNSGPKAGDSNSSSRSSSEAPRSPSTLRVAAGSFTAIAGPPEANLAGRRQSLATFGIFSLDGLQFSPRIRNIGRLQLYRLAGHGRHQLGCGLGRDRRLHLLHPFHQGSPPNRRPARVVSRRHLFVGTETSMGCEREGCGGSRGIAGTSPQPAPTSPTCTRPSQTSSGWG